MTGRSIWVTILLMTLSGLVKAQWHFIQLALVGAMGLTGMWIMHKLAQDYNKIKNPRPPPAAKLFFRRSAGETASAQEWSSSADMEGFNFEQVLREDPKGCAQRMVCQMAATPRHRLTAGEGNILDMLRSRDTTSKSPSNAWRVFRAAAQLGSESSDQHCIDKYPKCPYTRSEIARLIQL